MVHLINLRYRAEKEALDRSKSGSKDDVASPNIADLNPAQMKEFGILVSK